MLSNKNSVIVASAGSRKTTHLVEQALSLPSERILVTTYTNENIEQIRSYFISKSGCVPPNVTLIPWFGFLLRDGVRPYQNQLVDMGRVRTVVFGSLPPKAQFTKSTDTRNYYFSEAGDIYSERLSDFLCQNNRKSGGLIINRLAKMYDRVFIDELQDLAGYDLEFLELLFQSSMKILAVGDPRQATFSTNKATKNKQFRKSAIWSWIEEKEKSGLFAVEQRVECYRCNQAICDFADSIYPGLPKAVSKTTAATNHDGIFEIQRREVEDYLRKHNPVVLRHDKRAKTMGLTAFNIGLMKGRTFERVLIFPTGPMLKFLKTRDPAQAGDSSKLYVAVTRAKYSVAFVVD